MGSEGRRVRVTVKEKDPEHQGPAGSTSGMSLIQKHIRVLQQQGRRRPRAALPTRPQSGHREPWDRP